MDVQFQHMFEISKSFAVDDDDSESESEEIDSNKEIQELIDKARSNVIPEKSKKLYEKQYNLFREWCEKMKLGKNTTEAHLLAYFQKLSEDKAPTTLWATYTKIKSMVSWKECQDISTYKELQSFLKSKGKRHVPKKAMVFTMNEISKFLNTASDDEFLLHKVVLVIGIHGCLRTIELLNIREVDVKEEGMLYHIQIPNTKTYVPKSFVTSPEVHPIISKYIKLRPEGMERFFVQYRNQSCTRQNVGKGKLSDIPRGIARFLQLDQPQRYTGYALRRTSATIAADLGAVLLTIKRLGKWKSSTVAESYVNESRLNKTSTSKLIASGLNIKKPETITSGAFLKGYCDKPSTSHQNDSNDYIDDDLNEILNITQEHYQDVLETEFQCADKREKDEVFEKKIVEIPSQNSHLEVSRSKISNVTRQPLKILPNSPKFNVIQSQHDLSEQERQECQLTQDDCNEFFSTEIVMPQNKSKNKIKVNEQDTKENSCPISLFGKKEKDNQIYMFKNCNFHINNN